jgi:hypothetical protein
MDLSTGHWVKCASRAEVALTNQMMKYSRARGLARLGEGTCRRNLRCPTVLIIAVFRSNGGERMTSRGVNTEADYDELRRIEGEVDQGERQLAEQEALLVELRRQNEDTAKVREELERMRTQQRGREQQRQQLLSRLQP